MEYESGNTFVCKGDFLDTENVSLICKALTRCSYGKRVGISTDASKLAKAIENSAKGALTLNSSQVWDFGDGFFSQFRFLVDFCSLPSGIFISRQSEGIKLRIVGKHGLPLCDSEQKDFKNAFQKKSFKNTDILSCGEITDMTAVNMMYRRELLRQTDVELSEISCEIKSENRKINMLMEDCMYRLGCRKGDEYTFKINEDGTLINAFDRSCGWISNDRILAIIVNYETQNGRDVCVLPDAPLTLDKIARKNNKKIIRFRPYDEKNVKILNADTFMRDALFANIKLLKIIEETGKSLSKLNSEIPEFYIAKKRVNIKPENSNRILEYAEKSNAILTDDGAVLEFPQGKIRLSSINNGKKLSIISEAASYEIAKDLCRQADKYIEDGK